MFSSLYILFDIFITTRNTKNLHISNVLGTYNHARKTQSKQRHLIHVQYYIAVRLLKIPKLFEKLY